MTASENGRMIVWRLACSIAVLTGIGSVPSIAAAQGVAAAEAPPAWVAYAYKVTDAITIWLQADSETALRFRSYVDSTRNTRNERSSSLMLKIWVGEDGIVSRIDFTPFAYGQANSDLRSLIEGRHLATVPPPDMLQPLRLLVELQVPPSDWSEPLDFLQR